MSCSNANSDLLIEREDEGLPTGGVAERGYVLFHFVFGFYCAKPLPKQSGLPAAIILVTESLHRIHPAPFPYHRDIGEIYAVKGSTFHNAV